MEFEQEFVTTCQYCDREISGTLLDIASHKGQCEAAFGKKPLPMIISPTVKEKKDAWMRFENPLSDYEFFVG